MENKDKRNEQPEKEKPKRSFNFYWIYGIIILAILSINLFQNTGSMVKINPMEYQEMASKGDVDHIVIVNDQVVKVFIKKDRLGKEPHRSKIKGSPISGDNIVGPHYAFNQGTADVQKNEIVTDAKKYGIPYEYETQDTRGWDILYWILFFGAMIAIWMFVMRRLGGGGGPGGQIFNIGKSRAQVFEGSKTTNVTFDDVAGLAEAKEELQEIVD
ncbi:MAG TPA: peptidase M41, partial [Flavobacteriales bacterium]|nr:peptidase M41 [Flavobacteriales bacterium]